MSTSQVRQTSKPLESRRGQAMIPLEPSGESGKDLGFIRFLGSKTLKHTFICLELSGL